MFLKDFDAGFMNSYLPARKCCALTIPVVIVMALIVNLLPSSLSFAQDSVSEPALSDTSTLSPADNASENSETLEPVYTAPTETVPEVSAAPLLPGSEAVSAENPELPTPTFYQPDPSMALADPSGAQLPLSISDEEAEAEKRREAFNAALQSLLPLKPEEIRELLENFDRTQESVELPVYPAPVPEIAVETISMEPGVKPAVVKVAYGNVTTFNVLDMTGAPWPIEDISWAGNFEIVESGTQDGSNILRITPQSEFATGNMSLRLLTLKTPLIISLETSRDKVHYRFDAVIPENGPLAETPLIDQGITTAAGGDPSMSSVLQGIAPKKSQKLAVSGLDSRTTAYRIGRQTYLRTPLTLLSPAWNSSVSSADGMRVYTIPNAPVVLLSDKGQMVRARISERLNSLEDTLP